MRRVRFIPAFRRAVSPPGRLALLLGLLVLLAGCSDISYYWQASAGQWDILKRRRPIETVLADEEVGTETKRKLRLIQEVQTFGSERLALLEDGHYRYYADLGRPYVSWLVVAAEPLALEEYTFCYLVAGCMGYKGFFERADAEALAAELAEQGYDTLVRPVRAYSTLGWFDDPVLNTFLDNEDMLLISTILHEQAHRRFYLKGDTRFNESFAMCVEEAGLRRFVRERLGERPGLVERFAAYQADRERFVRIVMDARERLEALYASDLPEAEKRARKAEIFQAMRQDYKSRRDSFKILSYDGWFARDLNNAHMMGLGQYHQYVAGFHALLEQNDHDFARFFDAVEELSRLPRPEREARLEQLEEQRIVAAADATKP